MRRISGTQEPHAVPFADAATAIGIAEDGRIGQSEIGIGPVEQPRIRRGVVGDLQALRNVEMADICHLNSSGRKKTAPPLWGTDAVVQDRLG